MADNRGDGAPTDAVSAGPLEHFRAHAPDLAAALESSSASITRAAHSPGDNMSVTCVWTVDESGTSRMPSHIVLSLTPDAPLTARLRGITTSMMQEASEQVLDLSRQLRDQGELTDPDTALPILREFVSILHTQHPKGPRSNPAAYYETFMMIVDWWRSGGSETPAKDLQDALGLSAGTYWSQVKRAARYVDTSDDGTLQRIEKANRLARDIKSGDLYGR